MTERIEPPEPSEPTEPPADAAGTVNPEPAPDAAGIGSPQPAADAAGTGSPQPAADAAGTGSPQPAADAAAADAPAALEPAPAPRPVVAWEAPAPPAAPASGAAAPVVAWEATTPPSAPPPGQAAIGSYAGGHPPFSLGGLLADTFARYGADPIRFFVLAAAASVLSFAGTLLSLPPGAGVPARGADASGVVGLLSFVVGLVTSSAMFALAEGGPSMAFGRVLRRGVERAGWLFLTSIIVGLGLFVLFLVAAIPVIVLGLLSPTAAVLAFIPVILVFFWLGIRIAFALPANVADNLNSIDALKVSWRATRPSGVWLRIVGAAVLLGLLVLPASAGGLFLIFLGTFGGQPLLVIAMSSLLAFFTPLTALLIYSAYRRLVPPLEPSWIGTPVVAPAAAAPIAPEAAAPPQAAAPLAAPVAPPAAPVAPPPSAFRVPPFDTAAKALLALVLVLDVAGVAAIPYVIGEAIAGRITLPRFPTGQPFGADGDGPVEPGTVAFGRAGNLDSCTIQGRSLVVSRTQPIVWIAALEEPAGPNDEVRVVLRQDTISRQRQTLPAGDYDCVGIEVPESFDRGVWTVQVLVNGLPVAGGNVFVR